MKTLKYHFKLQDTLQNVVCTIIFFILKKKFGEIILTIAQKIMFGHIVPPPPLPRTGGGPPNPAYMLAVAGHNGVGPPNQAYRPTCWRWQVKVVLDRPILLTAVAGQSDGQGGCGLRFSGLFRRTPVGKGACSCMFGAFLWIKCAKGAVGCVLAMRAG